MYGIPNMKLEKHIIDRRIELMEEEGVVFKTNAGIENKNKFNNYIKNLIVLFLLVVVKKLEILKHQGEMPKVFTLLLII